MKNFWWLFGIMLLWLSQQTLYSSESVKQEVSSVDEKTKRNLIQMACEARKKAYAPYSHYLVGSALLTSEGQIFQGSNIENASYGLACCSERVALFKAVSEGITDFVAIAIVTKDGGSPCGACRQVLNEFNPNLVVLIGNENCHLLKETTLSTLLPDAFGPHNLD
jgi:cytidine deaminase